MATATKLVINGCSLRSQHAFVLMRGHGAIRPQLQLSAEHVQSSSNPKMSIFSHFLKSVEQLEFCHDWL